MHIAILFILSIFVSSQSFAVEAFDYIEMQYINIEGRTYEIPVGNKDRKDDLYYLKKAMNGDKEALEIFLGGSEKRLFYIGKESPLWLSVDKDSNFKVIVPGEKNAKS